MPRKPIIHTMVATGLALSGTAKATTTDVDDLIIATEAGAGYDVTDDEFFFGGDDIGDGILSDEDVIDPLDGGVIYNSSPDDLEFAQKKPEALKRPIKRPAKAAAKKDINPQKLPGKRKPRESGVISGSNADTIYAGSIGSNADTIYAGSAGDGVISNPIQGGGFSRTPGSGLKTTGGGSITTSGGGKIKIGN